MTAAAPQKTVPLRDRFRSHTVLADPDALRHLAHLEVRNLRAASISNRRYVLARFRDWLRRPLREATEDDLARWQAERAAVLTAASLRFEMTSVQMFYRWAVRERIVAADPTARLDPPRMPRRVPRPISNPDLITAIEQADPLVRLILSLAAFAGLRACEIARLDWADVDLDEGIIRVEDGKGGHQRTLPMASRLRTELSLSSEVTVRAAPTHPRTGPVVPRLQGQGYNKPHRISQLANVHLGAVRAGLTLHQCRHWFATSTYAACRDLRAVQDLMGHANPATTAMYTKSVPGVGAAAVEAAASGL